MYSYITARYAQVRSLLFKMLNVINKQKNLY